MTQTATVISLNGNTAVIEVSRRSMCDGCHQTECGSGCPMSGIFSSGKSMTANAVNDIGATPGSKVEIETSDRSVLLTAVAVFLLPIVIGGVFYALAVYLQLSSAISALMSLFGFIIPFVILKLTETKRREQAPLIRIIRILSDDTGYSPSDMD